LPVFHKKSQLIYVN